MAAGCPPGTRLNFIEVHSRSYPSLIAAAAPGPQTSTSLDNAQLGAISADVGSVRYDTDVQKRIYLFGGDIHEGLSSADVLEMPLEAMPIPGPGGPVTVDIGPFHPEKWMSMRAYDVGLCSVYPDTSGISPLLRQLTWDGVAKSFIQGVDSAFAASGATRTGSATFTPILRTNGTYDPEGDRFRFSATYFAQNLGGAVGCDSVTLQISAEMGWHRQPAVVSYPPQCLYPSAPGNTIQTHDGQTWDFPGSSTPSVCRPARRTAP